MPLTPLGVELRKVTGAFKTTWKADRQAKKGFGDTIKNAKAAAKAQSTASRHALKTTGYIRRKPAAAMVTSVVTTTETIPIVVTPGIVEVVANGPGYFVSGPGA